MKCKTINTYVSELFPVSPLLFLFQFSQSDKPISFNWIKFFSSTLSSVPLFSIYFVIKTLSQDASLFHKDEDDIFISWNISYSFFNLFHLTLTYLLADWLKSRKRYLIMYTLLLCLDISGNLKFKLSFMLSYNIFLFSPF